MGKDRRPNVVVCLCDQMRAHEVGCYGGQAATPHIDALAAAGVRFEHAASSNPVCMPARSCLLSGQYSRTCMGYLSNVVEPLPDGRKALPEYPVRERVHLPDPTLAETLRDAGYRTELIGKWHVHPAPEVVGFDHALYPRVHHRHTGQRFLETGQHERPVDGYSVEFEARKLREFLDRPHGRPFFLFYSISPPHMPLMDMPERYREMVRPEEVRLRPNVWRDGQMAASEEWFRVYAWDFLYYQEKLPHTLALPEGFDLRALTALYLGAIAWVDDMVGRLMEGLRASGLLESTLVVFTSDHGDNLGSHHLFNKDQLFEESIRVPLVVSWPGRLRPRVVTEQVAQTVDLAPTLASLAGAPMRSRAQGRDLTPVIEGRASRLEESGAFVETSGGLIGLRTPERMVGARLAADRRTVAEPVHCHYDLRADPYEMESLPDDAEASALRERLLRWHRETPWMRPRRPPS